MGFPGGSDSKESACSAGDQSSIPGTGKFPGDGNGNSHHYSWLENTIGSQRVGHDWVTSLSLNHQRQPYGKSVDMVQLNWRYRVDLLDFKSERFESLNLG